MENISHQEEKYKKKKCQLDDSALTGASLPRIKQEYILE